MMQFMQRFLQFESVVLIAIAVGFLLALAFPGFRERGTSGFLWIIWLFVAVLAIISWFLFMFA